MSYVVDFKTTFTKNLPGKPFSSWLATVEYADLNGLFPEIAEVNWPDVKSSITSFYSISRPTIGQTPGVSSYSEEITDSGVHVTLTFNSKADYDLYADYCVANKRDGMTPGFAIKIPEKTIDQCFSINGREVTLEGGVYVDEFPSIEGWIFAQYHVTYGITKSCVHTQT